MQPLFFKADVLKVNEKTLAQHEHIGYLISRKDKELSHATHRPYGHDQRANEIHELRRDTSGYVHLMADMIQGSFYCLSCSLLRVVEFEVEA